MLIEIYSFFILNTVLVLGINVPDDTRNDSVICMDKTLLNSCTKTCGESQCDMDSFCGEDKRCIYCYDAICKSTPIKHGCEISCAKRFPDMYKVYFSHAKKECRQDNTFDSETLLTLLVVSVIVNIVLVAAGLIYFLCWNRLLNVVRYSRGTCKKKSPSLVVNNSNMESQTDALVVTGRS